MSVFEQLLAYSLNNKVIYINSDISIGSLSDQYNELVCVMWCDELILV